jgi:hypothetical protein
MTEAKPKKVFAKISDRDREEALQVSQKQLIERGWPDFVAQLPEAYVVGLCTMDRLAAGQNTVQVSHSVFREALFETSAWWIDGLGEVSLRDLCDLGLIFCVDPGTPYGVHGRRACSGTYMLSRFNPLPPRKRKKQKKKSNP